MKGYYDDKRKEAERIERLEQENQRLREVERAARNWNDCLNLLIDMSESTEPDGTNCKYSTGAMLDAEQAFNEAEHGLRQALQPKEES